MESKPPVICVSICEQSIRAAEEAIVRAAPVADLIEVRLDCLDAFQIGGDFRHVGHLLENLSKPAIVTYRPAEQGGTHELNFGARFSFWVFNRPVTNGYFDIEFDFARNPFLFDYVSQPDWSRVICSYHDFIGMPSDLDDLYNQMAQTPARILKIAVQADDAIDCLPVFRLLDRARADKREMIAIAMGPAGIATRILGPSRGAFLTYASLESETATAPGQISARELREVYRIEKIDRQTQIFGLMGRPVSHSLSPRMHNAGFAALETNAVYIPFEVNDAKAFIRRMVHPRSREIDWNLCGLSVTAPHKSAVMDQLDWIDPVAQAIGAVNAIVVAGDALHGYNTDASGLIKPLVKELGNLEKSHCAVIGAGGAASAALWALAQEGAEITLFARNVVRAGTLAEKFSVDCKTLEGVSFAGFDVVINATPLGTVRQFEDQTPVTGQQLRGARLAYDLVYNPTDTRFLRQAREAGCKTLGGLPMLVAQAAEQFRLWTGETAPEGVMQEAARQEMER